MSPTLLAGIVMGILVEIWTYVWGFAGWYKDQSLMNLLYVGILIQLGILVWGLRRTASQGNGYGRQVAAGLGMNVIGAAIIMLGGYIFMAIVFPNYFEETNAIRAAMAAERGMTRPQIDQMLEILKKIQTPFRVALFWSIQTVVTGLVFSLVIAAFVRKKKA